MSFLCCEKALSNGEFHIAYGDGALNGLRLMPNSTMIIPFNSGFNTLCFNTLVTKSIQIELNKYLIKFCEHLFRVKKKREIIGRWNESFSHEEIEQND